VTIPRLHDPNETHRFWIELGALHWRSLRRFFATVKTHIDPSATMEESKGILQRTFIFTGNLRARNCMREYMRQLEIDDE
jgi:hypothetical protein